jgi:tol-pal system protein YbgF
MKNIPFSFAHRPLRLAVALACLLVASSASAGLFEDDEARRAILDVRQKVEALRVDADKRIADEVQRSADDTAQLRRSLLELQNQLELIRTDMAKLRGQNEQMARDLSEFQRTEKDTNQVLTERLRKFEPARVTVDGREFLVETAEKRDYEAALGVFRKGDFGNAQLNFVEFLNRYPTTGYRPSVLFWLGNAQYAVKNYKEALASFRALVAGTPDHTRVPESILAMANCQLEMKESRAARKTLEELIANYPNTEAAVAAKDRLARFK